jgi:hypothetical protein
MLTAAALLLAIIGLVVLAAAILTYSTILALIVIALAAVGLLLLASDTEGGLVTAPVERVVPAPEWPGHVLEIFRVLAGVAAMVVSQTSLVTSERSPDPALQWTVFLLGVFILFHFLIGWIVVLLPIYAGHDEQVPNPFNAVANVLVTAPGVVLGLLAVFGTAGALTTVVKVAAVALATALLLGIVLNGLVSMQDVGNPPRSTVIRLMFNLTLWALVLGILGIAMGVVYRT